MNQKYLKWLIVGTGLCVLGGIFLLGGYAIIEPTQLMAVVSSATTTSVTLTVDEQISLTPPASIALSPNIDTTQQSSVGSGSWTVKTNANGGYTLKFTTSGANALTNGTSTFTDLSTTTPTAWSEAGASSYVWGYSAYGDDVATSTWGDGVICGTTTADVLLTDLNYAGFATATTTTTAAASSAAATTPSGTATTLCIAAEEGDNIYAPAGAYAATVTGTAATQ